MDPVLNAPEYKCIVGSDSNFILITYSILYNNTVECDKGENYCEGAYVPKCIPDKDEDCVQDEQVNFTSKDE